MKTSDIIKNLVDRINRDLAPSGAFEALTAYDKNGISYPLKKTYFAFKANEDDVSFFEDENSQCCKKTKLTVLATAYSPLKEKAIEAYTRCETVLDFLCDAFTPTLTGYIIGKAEADNDLQAFKISCKLIFEFEQCPAYSLPNSVILPFADFLCKTHVLDETSHLTAAEKEKLGEPFVFGTYTGNGLASQNIAVDFHPRIVIVFAANSTLIGTDGTNISAYFAVAARSKSTRGVSISSSGFTAKQADSTAWKKTYAKLNENDQNYYYIAFK